MKQTTNQTKKSVYSKWQILSLLLSVAFILASCTPNMQAITVGRGGKNTKLDGNGEGYEGIVALNGKFYNWQPSPYCINSNGQEIVSHFDLISFGLEGVPMSLGNRCNSQGSMVHANQIEYAKYNPVIMSYEGRIYEKEIFSTGLGDTVILCRTMDSGLNEGLDIQVRSGNRLSSNFDPEAHAVNIVPSDGEQVNLIGRAISTQGIYSVAYYMNSGMYDVSEFSLEVNMNSYNPTTKKYMGIYSRQNTFPNPDITGSYQVECVVEL